ncbi:hypothetical protein HDU76_010374, partial [Blyttiomyces sp. JEL0837]
PTSKSTSDIGLSSPVASHLLAVETNHTKAAVGSKLTNSVNGVDIAPQIETRREDSSTSIRSSVARTMSADAHTKKGNLINFDMLVPELENRVMALKHEISTTPNGNRVGVKELEMKLFRATRRLEGFRRATELASTTSIIREGDAAIIVAPKITNNGSEITSGTVNQSSKQPNEKAVQVDLEPTCESCVQISALLIAQITEELKKEFQLKLVQMQHRMEVKIDKTVEAAIAPLQAEIVSLRSQVKQQSNVVHNTEEISQPANGQGEPVNGTNLMNSDNACDEQSPPVKDVEALVADATMRQRLRELAREAVKAFETRQEIQAQKRSLQHRLAREAVDEVQGRKEVHAHKQKLLRAAAIATEAVTAAGTMLERQIKAKKLSLALAMEAVTVVEARMQRARKAHEEEQAAVAAGAHLERQQQLANDERAAKEAEVRAHVERERRGRDEQRAWALKLVAEATETLEAAKMELSKAKKLETDVLNNATKARKEFQEFKLESQTKAGILADEFAAKAEKTRNP